MDTLHARVRAQQRGIPPLIHHWLDQYGEEFYDGHGGVIRFFTRKCIRDIERNEGRLPVRRMREFFDTYKVESSHDGLTITIGRRYKHVKRP